MAKKDFKSMIKINTYEDIFGGPVTLNEVQYVDLKLLHDFKDHPYQVKDDEDMEKLVESIKEQGILDPAIVRYRDEGGYEIISGHRRHHAAIRAGLRDMPVIIRDIDDDAATLAMVDANLHREKLLPSEKAFAYKMKMEALSHQGKNDSTSRQIVGKLETADIIGEGTGTSGRQIQRYIRLNELNPKLQRLVDERKMGITPAVEVSYLSPAEQDLLMETIESEQTTPSLSQAQKMRKMSKEGSLNEDTMLDLMQAQKKPEGMDIVLRYPTMNSMNLSCSQRMGKRSEKGQVQTDEKMYFHSYFNSYDCGYDRIIFRVCNEPKIYDRILRSDGSALY